MKTPACTKLKKGSVKKRLSHDNIVWMGSRPAKEQIRSKMAFWISELIQRDPYFSNGGKGPSMTPTKGDEARVWLTFCIKNPRGCRIPSADGALMEFTAYEIQQIQEMTSDALGISIPGQAPAPLPPEGVFIPIPQGIKSIHISEPRGILTEAGTIILGVEVYVVSGGHTYFTWSYAYGITEEAVRQMFYSNPGAFRIQNMN